MATPLLIDADMGVDDAVALTLALASPTFDLRAVVGVGGCVELGQVMVNIGRLLKALRPQARPAIGRGLDQTDLTLHDRRGLFGNDGLAECDLASDAALETADFRAVYRQAIEAAAGNLVVLTTGPLTNLATLLAEAPEWVRSIKHVYVTGGAVWTRGNITDAAEFNFYRDPQAAAKVLSSGLPITVAPLDVARMIHVDESHAARLAASGRRSGEILALLLRYPIERSGGLRHGKILMPDALALGSILWSDFFLRTRMRLDIQTQGERAGQSKPALGGDKSLHVNILTAVNAIDFLENVLESLCHEEFVV